MTEIACELCPCRFNSPFDDDAILCAGCGHSMFDHAAGAVEAADDLAEAVPEMRPALQKII